VVIPECSICEKPTTVATAVVEVDSSAASKNRHEAWDTYGENISSNVIPYTHPVPWQWNHKKCGPELGYWFDASRISNTRKAMGWTLHLSEKRWFPSTDWETLMRQLGYVENG
jgi:hypothetical protein